MSQKLVSFSACQLNRIFQTPRLPLISITLSCPFYSRHSFFYPLLKISVGNYFPTDILAIYEFITHLLLNLLRGQVFSISSPLVFFPSSKCCSYSRALIVCPCMDHAPHMCGGSFHTLRHWRQSRVKKARHFSLSHRLLLLRVFILLDSPTVMLLSIFY